MISMSLEVILKTHLLMIELVSIGGIICDYSNWHEN